jgi:hypothetical protein
VKLCYCDETGTGDEPVAVMAGIIVDSHRMHVTKLHWAELLEELSDLTDHAISELHTRDFYGGKGIWYGVDGDTRSAVIGVILNWLKERKHQIVFSAVHKERYRGALAAGTIPAEVRTLWRFMGLHLIRSLQRALQGLPKNKGNTILIFDNEEREELRFTDLINNPPGWSDTYYRRSKKQEPLDQIVDVPYFGDSKEVGLIQVADFIAYFLRRHIELAEGLSPPRYSDEARKLSEWVSQISDRCIVGAAIYPARGRCACANLFFDHAPETARNLLAVGA